MEDTDLGRTRVAVLIALALVSVGLVAASGFVFAEDQRSGEEILEDVQERYESADSVSADTVVTVETKENTTGFDASIAAAGEERARLNLSTDQGYVLTGTDGERLWIHDPETELTAVVTKQAGSEATVALLAGTDEPTGLGLADVLPGDIDENTTVGELREEFGEDEIPPELSELPQDATLAELSDGEEIAEQFEDLDLPLPDDAQDRDGIELGEWNDSALDAKIDEVELPEDWEDKTLAERWAA